MRLFSLLVLLPLSLGAIAQEEEQPSKPTTKLEAFQASTGSVIVRGFTTVGKIKGVAGIVSVDAREFLDAGNPARKVTGISFEIKDATRLQMENTSFVDADEIDSLLQGLDYIAKASKEITRLESFEAEYRTKGDFRLVVFNNSDDELSVAVSSGRIGKTSAYLEFEQLPELRQLIVAAKSKL